MKHILIIIVAICIVQGCSSPNVESDLKTVLVNQKFGNLPETLSDSLVSIQSSDQLFKIDPTLSNTIVGSQGTILIIPNSTIADKNGKVVTEEVVLSLIENYRIEDMILSNLQTIHNDQILESKGMIYFTAKDSKGNDLSIAKGKSIRIEFPQDGNDNRSEIFTAVRDKSGKINWNNIAEQPKSLTPYPIKFISKNRFMTECSDYYGITLDTIKDPYYNYYGKLTDFENTLLATSEFKERFQYHCWKDVLSIYIENIDKNLWEIDELVVKYFIQDSTERVKYWMDFVPPNPNGGSRTKTQIEAQEYLIKSTQDSFHQYILSFKKYAKQKLTKVDPNVLVDTTKLKGFNQTMIAYDAMNFGWVNVDFFYKDPKASPIKLVAKTNMDAPIISMIIKGRKVILSGYEHGSNEYWFTKNKDGYNKLPKGEKGIIVAIGMNNGNIDYAIKEIEIGKNEVEQLDMSIISSNDLKRKLKEYGS